MNDYHLDPPEEIELPECCEQEMNYDEATGVLTCAVCNTSIYPFPDYDDPPEPEPMKDIEPPFEDYPTTCPHGNAPESCDHCDHLSDLAYDAAREQRFFR